MKLFYGIQKKIQLKKNKVVNELIKLKHLENTPLKKKYLMKRARGGGVNP